ncbi:unnamed protein product [Mycena citricolor]|uniref:Anaphase-promoting complex subunit 4-like WD40 domain-containing protein n=1 Tax=Mycena citricolor TaxID=2018698 RepID=A0AAD2GV50_9AGAR|nr:unnamed protein product [Mycena citricolor]CAK5263210.1 unnamed protein product [Mycena citricolor]CAK5275301.1 unnamed protein product [Mycena citricolor]
MTQSRGWSPIGLVAGALVYPVVNPWREVDEIKESWLGLGLTYLLAQPSPDSNPYIIMSTPKEPEDTPEPQRVPSPPPHTTFSTRGILPPSFPTFKPREYRFNSSHAMNHVAWSCDGKRLAAVGIDKVTRVWVPEKGMEQKHATVFSGGHQDDVDYVSWNPTHPDLFCTSSQKDRRIVFWDARQSRYTQSVPLKVSPMLTSYSPNGRTLLYTSAGHSLFFLDLLKEGEDSKEIWRQNPTQRTVASFALWNHSGDGFATTYYSETSLRILDYPSLTRKEELPAHPGGCMALALDPRGRYLASGGFDSIVNLFDVEEWICTHTITACDHRINGISFSHDGEYLAIGSAGSYVEICGTETGLSLHRVPTSAPATAVTWHPSRHALAYCGQTRPREGGPAPVAVLGLFGMLE